MREGVLKNAFQGMLLFVMMLSLATMTEADELSSRLESHFNGNNIDHTVRFLNYESVDQAHADEFGGMRYLFMDFDLMTASVDTQTDIQTKVHKICNTVLADRQLIQNLSHSGYDMVSVSFDRQSQYDCL